MENSALVSMVSYILSDILSGSPSGLATYCVWHCILSSILYSIWKATKSPVELAFLSPLNKLGAFCHIFLFLVPIASLLIGGVLITISHN